MAIELLINKVISNLTPFDFEAHSQQKHLVYSYAQQVILLLKDKIYKISN